MPMIRAMRLLNAVEAGTTSGAQLETLLTADPGRLAEFNVLLGMRGQTRRMVASSTAMTAVAASSTAMTAVAASSTAMTAVAASSTAMTAVAASSTARLSVFNSDTALNAIDGSAIAIAAIKAAPTYIINATTDVDGSGTTTTLSGNYIMVGWSVLTTNNITITGRRAGSTVGTLVGASIAVGSTAATNNIMALKSPVTVKIDTAPTTVYLGVLPV